MTSNHLRIVQHSQNLGEYVDNNGPATLETLKSIGNMDAYGFAAAMTMLMDTGKFELIGDTVHAIK